MRESCTGIGGAQRARGASSLEAGRCPWGEGEMLEGTGGEGGGRGAPSGSPQEDTTRKREIRAKHVPSRPDSPRQRRKRGACEQREEAERRCHRRRADGGEERESGIAARRTRRLQCGDSEIL